MLSAELINTQIEQDSLGWTGQLRGDGLLLTLGSPLQPLKKRPTQVIDLADQASIDDLYEEPVTNWENYEIAPGEMLLASIEQPLRLGTALMGMIGGLSHLARIGLFVHVSSPFVLPGWSGHITLELVNTSPASLLLHHSMPIARLLIFAVDGHRPRDIASHPFYGRKTDLRSRYADEFSTNANQR
ncbi:hypothetical protein [Streptomyces sp. NPDC001422]|uniref:dCTP deaminase n=1 Tax=Streptomyces sp. NPDC001422 TaxID=3364575 RepID=UPI0036A8A41B